MPDLAGFYINLDRSTERRQQLSAQLAKTGLVRRYQRFAAVDGRRLKPGTYAISAGEAGCFMSHLGALEAGRKSGRHVHILEDDAILSTGIGMHLATIVGSAIESFDLVLTDMWVPAGPTFTGPAMALYNDYLANGAFNVLVNAYQACLPSYVVNAKSIDRLVALCREEVKAGLSVPIDIHISRLATSGAVRVGCLFPFVTSVRLSQILETTIQRPGDSVQERLITGSVRAAYYVEADLDALRRRLAEMDIRDVALDASRSSAIAVIDQIAAKQRAMRRRY